MQFQKIVWFIRFQPAVYQVLTGPILETKGMGLTFHKNGEKAKIGKKEETA